MGGAIVGGAGCSEPSHVRMGYISFDLCALIILGIEVNDSRTRRRCRQRVF